MFLSSSSSVLEWQAPGVEDHLLVAVVLEVLLVALVLQQVLGVVLPQPLRLVDVEGARLRLHLLALAAAGHRGRQPCGLRGGERREERERRARFSKARVVRSQTTYIYSRVVQAPAGVELFTRPSEIKLILTMWMIWYCRSLNCRGNNNSYLM